MIQKYKDWLSINGCAEKTILNYIHRIKKFLKKVKLEDINEENINKFFIELKRQYSPSTINGYKQTIKSFLKFLKKDINLPKNERIEETIPETIDEKFFKNNIIPVAECIFSNSIKVKAILYFMFYTGLRVGEIGNIKREHIDLENRTAKIIKRKNKKSLIIFFSKEVKNIIENYFKLEAEQENAFNIKTESIQSMFKKLKKHIKEINLHPHLFRHSFAVMTLKRGADIKRVGQLLGHKQLRTTERYAQLKNEDLQRSYDEWYK